VLLVDQVAAAAALVGLVELEIVHQHHHHKDLVVGMVHLLGLLIILVLVVEEEDLVVPETMLLVDLQDLEVMEQHLLSLVPQ